MKQVLAIFKRDVYKLSHNIIGMIIIVGVSVLPALYAWFNIAANWDPYGATGNIKVAVVSMDRGASIGSTHLNCGDEILKQLRGNDNINWQFLTNKNEALEGVKSGKYYACLIIPKNFSRNFASVLSPVYERPKLEYYVNQKSNAIAPKITNTAVNTIETQTNEMFVSTVTNALAKSLNVVTKDIKTGKYDFQGNVDKALDTAKSAIDGYKVTVDTIAVTMDNISTLMDNSAELMPTIGNSIDKANQTKGNVENAVDIIKVSVGSFSDSIGQSGKNIGNLYSNVENFVGEAQNDLNSDKNKAIEKLQAASENAQQIVDYQNMISQTVESLSGQTIVDEGALNQGVADFNNFTSQLCDTLNDASQTLKDGGELPQEKIDKINELITNSKETADGYVKNSYSQIFGVIESINSVYSGLDAQLGIIFDNLGEGGEQTAEKLSAVVAVHQSILDSYNSVKENLGNLSGSVGSDFTVTNSLLDSLISKQQEQIDNLNRLIETVQTGSEIPANTREELSAMITNSQNDLKALVENLYSQYSDISAKVDEGYQNAYDNILQAGNTAAENMGNIAQTLEDTSQMIAGTSQFANSAFNIYNQVKNIMPDTKVLADNLKDSAAQTQQTLNSINAALENAKNSDIDINVLEDLRNEVSKNSGNINQFKGQYLDNASQAINMLNSSVCGTIDSMSGILEQFNKDIPDIVTTFNNAGKSMDSIHDVFVSTSDMLGNFSSQIDEIKANADKLLGNTKLVSLLTQMVSDPESLAEFVSSPVELENTDIYPIENYGSAMTPFYSTLAIWVGAIVLVAILKTKVKEDKKLNNISPTKAYLGRMLLFIILGLIQSTIICLGDLYFLEIQCEEPIKFLISGWVSSIVFVMLVYTLTVSFGDIGKAISVILLVLQIAGSGGTFPIDVVPEFFQKFYPFMPFTYSINAMRECIAGIYGNHLLIDLLKVLAFIIPSLFLGLVLRRPLIKGAEFFEERIKDTDLM